MAEQVAVKCEPPDVAPPPPDVAPPPPVQGRPSSKREELLVPAELKGDEQFRDAFLSRVNAVLEAWPGSEQYLLDRYPTKESQAQFARDLEAYFPRAHDVAYVAAPPNGMQTAYVHVVDLGFTRSCSTKPAPFLKTVQALVDEIISHGFTTHGNPTMNDSRMAADDCLFFDSGCRILIIQQFCVLPSSCLLHSPGEPLMIAGTPAEASGRHFWTKYVKGMARATTALLVADQLMVCGVDVSKVCP